MKRVVAFLFAILGVIVCGADAYTTMSAVNYNAQSGTQIGDADEGGRYVGWIENGDYIRFDGVDFGTGAVGVKARVSSNNDGGKIEIREGSLTGKILGTIPVANTGGWQEFKNVTASVLAAAGTKTIYFKFTGGTGYLMNVKWFLFEKGGVALPVGKYVTLVAKHSGKALHVSNWSKDIKAPIIQYDNNKTENSQWMLEDAGQGLFRIKNRYSQLYFEVGGHSVNNGGIIQQYSVVTTHEFQLWRIEYVKDGYFRLINKGSGKAADVSGGSTANGAQIVQWDYRGTENQLFKFDDRAALSRVTGVNLSPSSAALKPGETIKLNCTIVPTEAVNKNLLWKSSNNNVVVAASDGTITGIAPGNAIITVSSADTGVSDTCTVTVAPSSTFYNGATETTSLIGLSNGKIAYGKYLNRGETNRDNQIPDFSYAGYKKGGVKLPNAPVKITLYPQSGDNSTRIQEAINYVAGLPADGNGVKGAVLLKKGRYQVNKTININKSGVVLRGEGQGADGTIIYDAQTVQNNCIEMGGAYSINEVSGAKTKITSAYNGSGTRSFTVESPSYFRPGDDVYVQKTVNQTWLDDLGMEQYGWTTSRYSVKHMRKITAVEGNKITIDIPLVDTIENKYGGGVLIKITKNVAVQNCGVENIRIDSYYRNSTDEAHGWAAVQMEGIENSWVKNVTAVHFGYSCVNMAGDANFNTVQDCAYIEPISEVTGGRRYSFAIQSGTGNLFQRCYTNGGRHDYVTGALAAGPNVFLDCYSENCKSNTGPHHRWATGILFDNVLTAEASVENRKDSGSGHGWAGAQIVWWNCETQNIICDAPKGGMNFAIGCTGSRREGNWAPEEPAGYFEGHGKHTALRSLYIQQLYDRLGRQALENTLTTDQLTGDIYDALDAWAGK